MKRLILLVLLGILAVGCVRNAGSDQKQDGVMVEFGKTSLATIVCAESTRNREGYTDDMPLLIADLFKSRLEKREIPTGALRKYRRAGIMDNEALKDMKMQGNRILIEIALTPRRKNLSTDYLYINAFFAPNGKFDRVEKLLFMPFILKNHYSDPESKYIGIQTEMAPLIDDALDIFFYQANELKMDL